MKARDVGRLGDAILLEGAVDSVAREQGLRAQWLVGLLAEVTLQARSVDPLHTGVVATESVSARCDISDAQVTADDLHLDVMDQITLGYNNTSSLVASHKGKFGWQRPVTVYGVQVCVAHTGILDVDKDFVWTWLLDVDFFVFHWTSGLLNDHSHLLLGYFLRHFKG